METEIGWAPPNLPLKFLAPNERDRFDYHAMNIRAKMSVNEVVSSTYSDTVKLSPVMGGSSSAEDNSFARATPSGKLELTIDNPALKGVMKPGQVYYVDLSLVPEPSKA